MIEQFVEDLVKRSTPHVGVYEKDGIKYCAKCNEPKQAWISWFPDDDGNPTKNLVPVMCKCDIAREAEDKDRNRQMDFDDAMRSVRLALQTKRDDIRWRFDQDDAPDNPIAKTCRRYVEEWESMKADNMGILFFGNKGVGKTFYASCIANALKAKRVLVGFTSAPNLMNILGKWDKTEIFDAITRCHLLIIDDLGAERGNDYSGELMYSVIDARYKTGKPTIVTTNNDLEEMRNESEIWRSRIYDRVIEMCPITLRMQGESRREGIAEARKQKARELLRSSGKGIENGN